MSRHAVLDILAHGIAGAVQHATATLRRHSGGGLRQINDHVLHDIGLTRHDLWGVGAEPLFRIPACRHPSPADGSYQARAEVFTRGLRNAERLLAEENRLA